MFDEFFLASPAPPPSHTSVLDGPPKTRASDYFLLPAKADSIPNTNAATPPPGPVNPPIQFGKDSLVQFLHSVEPRTPLDVLERLQEFSARIRRLCEDPVIQLEEPISLRQLVRVSKRAAHYPQEVAENLVNIPLSRSFVLYLTLSRYLHA